MQSLFVWHFPMICGVGGFPDTTRANLGILEESVGSKSGDNFLELYRMFLGAKGGPTISILWSANIYALSSDGAWIMNSFRVFRVKLQTESLTTRLAGIQRIKNLLPHYAAVMKFVFLNTKQ